MTPIVIPLTRDALARLKEHIPYRDRWTRDLAGLPNVVLLTPRGIEVHFVVDEDREPCLH